MKKHQTKMKKLLLLSLISLLVSLVHGTNLKLIDGHYTNSDAEYIVLEKATPDLSVYNFETRVQSGCVHGVWILYTKVNYEFGGYKYVYSSSNQCFVTEKYFENSFSSARFAGDANNYNRSSLTLYERRYFFGKEFKVFGDIASYDASISSSIISTGITSWTLYEEENYQGRAVCIRGPNNSGKWYPGFFLAQDDFYNMGKKIKSIRMGCHSENKITAPFVPEAKLIHRH